MQVKQGRKYKKAPLRRKDTARQRILIDSGANMIAFQTATRGHAANLVPYFAGVATASGSSNTNLGVSQKGTVGIIFQTGLSTEPDVVFIDDLKHNVAGSTVLDTQYGVTSIFHNGMVHLVDSSSINGLPQNWKMLASSHYDTKTGLPFLDIDLPRLSNRDTLGSTKKNGADPAPHSDSGQPIMKKAGIQQVRRAVAQRKLRPHERRGADQTQINVAVCSCLNSSRIKTKEPKKSNDALPINRTKTRTCKSKKRELQINMAITSPSGKMIGSSSSVETAIASPNSEEDSDLERKSERRVPPRASAAMKELPMFLRSLQTVMTPNWFEFGNEMLKIYDNRVSAHESEKLPHTYSQQGAPARAVRHGPPAVAPLTPVDTFNGMNWDDAPFDGQPLSREEQQRLASSFVLRPDRVFMLKSSKIKVQLPEEQDAMVAWMRRVSQDGIWHATGGGRIQGHRFPRTFPPPLRSGQSRNGAGLCH